MIDTFINERYPIKLLPHRVKFHRARPKWESERLESMHDLVQPGWVVYDVGAEEGDFTALYGSWVGPMGRIVAVEPSPGYWPAIRATWEGNDLGLPPVCIPAFAGDTTYEPTTPRWSDKDRANIAIQLDGWPAASTWPITPDYGFRMLCERQLDTPGWRMDDLAEWVSATEMIGLPDAIVFDIEGAEWHALMGCQRLCEQGGKRPLLWVSVHDENMIHAYGHQLSDIIRLVISWDYDYRYLGTHGGEDFWLFTPMEA